MRSPDSRRSLVETMLRVVSVAAMAMLAVRLWTGATRVQPEAGATSVSLDSSLATWSREAPRSATVRASMLPDAKQRDWLVAIRRTGSRLTWSVADSAAGALVIEPGPLPEALARLSVVGKPQSTVSLTDDLGRIDSVRLGRGGAASRQLRPLGAIRASLGSGSASTATRDSLVVKPVLLIGSAGWEAKFVAAALEEEGWTVSTRMQVAPGAVVRQGSNATIDTGSYGAIVVIDSASPLDAGSIQRFVNEGGGLVASGPGVRHPALRALLPREVQQKPGALGAMLGPTPRLGLSARVLVYQPNHVVFERRDEAVVGSALRVGSGRVVSMGYDDTWRLRMVSPNENAPRQHREWWSALVGSAAMTRLVLRDAPAVDEAPFAAAVAALGPPVASHDPPADGRPFPWEALLAAIAAGALLAEWLSRRLRGVA
jgi:hypothetical protein